MAPSKRPREEDSTSRSSTTKKPRHGFKVGPDNLPDGTWRRKVIAIKKDLIHKAKVKKSYAKLRAREPLKEERNLYAEDEDKEDEVEKDEEGEDAAEGDEAVELHPQRKAMLDEPETDTAAKVVPRYSNNSEDVREKKRERSEKRGAKPAYFAKELAFAEKQKAEQKARREEFERKEREKKAKIEERERFRRQMAKARSGGKNGQRKLGRESQVLLEKVQRAVGSTALMDVKAVEGSRGKLGETYDTHEIIADEFNQGLFTRSMASMNDAPNKRFASWRFLEGLFPVLH
ncbi:hypothetical protein NHQ30_006126 [Ciborinia camelliae]|nr:hypothetical protein NHQ30_006126 [Ciborinia camelliae]